MREVISIGAIILAAIYFVTLGVANLVALETQMHWGLAVIAMSALIFFKVWPAIPALAYLGAHLVWGWPWWVAGGLAFPICIYIVAHYWARIGDFWHRPKNRRRV